MEELDLIKAEVFRDFQESNASIYRKIDEIGGQVSRLQGEKQDQTSQMSDIEQ